MLPQEWAAFLGVTGVTGVIDVIFDEQEIAIAVMYIMAIAAGHVAETQGMTGSFVSVRTRLLMALETDFLLRQRLEYRVAILMDRVAGYTAHVDTLVLTAEPAHVTVLMAAQAGLVLLGNRGQVILTKGAGHWRFGFLLGLGVSVRRAMAAFALFV